MLSDEERREIDAEWRARVARQAARERAVGLVVAVLAVLFVVVGILATAGD